MAFLELTSDIILLLVEECSDLEHGNLLYYPLYHTCKALQLTLQPKAEEQRASKDSNFLCKCASEGYLDLLKWGIHYAGCEMDEKPWWNAVSSGKLEIVKWLYESGYDACTYGHFFAAKDGHMEVLQWLDANGFTLNWTDVHHAALSRGHKEIEDWAYAKRIEERPLTNDERLVHIHYLIEGRQFERLKSTYTKHEILEKMVSDEIRWSMNGDEKDIDILKWWVEEIGGELPKEVDYSHGSAGIEVWKYLVQLGGSLNSGNLSAAIADQNIKLIQWFLSQGLSAGNNQALFNDCITDITMLNWYKEEVGPPMWYENSFALCPTVEIIKWALANGCPEPKDKLAHCINVSNYYWNFDLLKWAVKQGWPINEEVATKVAKHGVVARLKWVLEKLEPGLSKKKGLEIYKRAITSNKLEMIRWVFEKRGVDIKPFVDHIITSQSLRIIQWLEEKDLLFYDERLCESHDPRIREIMKKYKNNGPRVTLLR